VSFVYEVGGVVTSGDASHNLYMEHDRTVPTRAEVVAVAVKCSNSCDTAKARSPHSGAPWSISCSEGAQCNTDVKPVKVFANLSPPRCLNQAEIQLPLEPLNCGSLRMDRAASRP